MHCLAGVSRSVSLVIAYLIKHRNMNYDDAYFMIKSRRKIVTINNNFRFIQTMVLKDSSDNISKRLVLEEFHTLLKEDMHYNYHHKDQGTIITFLLKSIMNQPLMQDKHFHQLKNMNINILIQKEEPIYLEEKV